MKRDREDKYIVKENKTLDCNQDDISIPANVDMLGAGAMGSVWMGCCKDNCSFAIKVIYLGHNDQRILLFNRECVIATYAGDYMKIGPSVYRYFTGKIKGTCDYNEDCGYIVSDILSKNFMDELETTKRISMQKMYYKQMMKIVKKLSESKFINDDPNSGNWMIDKDNILYLIDYDQVVQVNDLDFDLIYYYNLSKIKYFIFDSSDGFISEINDAFYEEYQTASRQLLKIFKTRDAINKKMIEIKNKVYVLVKSQSIDDIELDEI